MDSLTGETATWWLVSSAKNIRKLKLALQKLHLYDQQRKIVTITKDKHELAIPIARDLREDLADNADLKRLVENSSARIEFQHLESKNNRISPKQKLYKSLEDLFVKKGLNLSDELKEEIPVHWEKHGDLVLLSDKCFLSWEWSGLGDELWKITARALGAKRLGKKSVITDNNYRSPRVSLLLGDSGWVSHMDNGITYTYDVTKCMFSSGNITEKIRIGKFDCSDQIIVDLYAGIGYFVLPYLIHAYASIVYACEWNPDAVDALKKNLVLNGVDDKCTVYDGDNRKFPHQGIADHVNLGLIPSSEDSWPIACGALRTDIGGWLHIHGNVTSYKAEQQDITTGRLEENIPSCNRRIKIEWIEWCKYVIKKIRTLLLKTNSPSAVSDWDVIVCHIEHVKPYAPHIDHLVLDVECRPQK